MNTRLLTWLCCPVCREDLDLSVFREADGIEEGALTCRGCRRVFPIIDGIPRMLPDALMPQVLAYHRQFFERYRTATSACVLRAVGDRHDAWWDTEARTLESYSYQWRKFKQMFPQWEDVFRSSIAPITPDFFPGRVGLDAGCGFGRSLVYAAKYGAEVIGLDLSEAIEAARENTRHLPSVYLVQGDLYHPPLRAASLDFVYSIGVLILVPDPQAGFRSLSRLVKPAAPMFIWVLPRGRGRQIAIFEAARAVTTRLPLRVLDAVCLALSLAQWAAFIVPYKMLKMFRATAALAERLPFTLYARYPFRAMHSDWFDALSAPVLHYHRRDEVAEWYRDAAFEQVVVSLPWEGRAVGIAPPPVAPSPTV